MANFREIMKPDYPSVTRTYHTTFNFKTVIDALDKQGIDYKEGVKGRIFFRLPTLDQTCIEFCRGGKLMLKGSHNLKDVLHDDRIITTLFKIQSEHFPNIIAASYKLSSVQASRRWLRKILAQCVKALMNKSYTANDETTDEVMKNIWFLANKDKPATNPEDEIINYKTNVLLRYFHLLLTGRKDTQFTPLQFLDAFQIDNNHIMAVLDPKTGNNLTPQGAYNTIYLFNAPPAEIKPPGLIKSNKPLPNGWYVLLVFVRQSPSIEKELFQE